jgi:hypothetical protein
MTGTYTLTSTDISTVPFDNLATIQTIRCTSAPKPTGYEPSAFDVTGIPISNYFCLADGNRQVIAVETNNGTVLPVGVAVNVPYKFTSLALRACPPNASYVVVTA